MATFGKVRVGPVTRNSNGQIVVDFPAGDTEGLALDVGASPASANERATIKLGDFKLGQDTAGDGNKNFGIYNADTGALVSELVTAGGIVNGEVFRSTIPLIVAPTGSMGNNGALTSGTVNPLVYLKTYTWFPTGAIFTASPAGWYWTVWTTTTAATVYQETWSGSGNPVAVASPTAWVKTGPGAFTGPTAEAAYISIAMPALGVNSIVTVLKKTTQTNNANAKTSLNRMTNVAGTTFHTDTLTSLLEVSSAKFIQVNGVADKQLVRGLADGATGFVREAAALKTETTSAAWVLAITVSKGTATDVVVIEGLQVLLEK